MSDDRTRLLYGPYEAPPLKVRDRTTCLYRDAPVVVYGWSLAPIPWPLCYRADTLRPCGKGLLVCGDLARAIRSESAAALAYWWGVGGCTVGKWRRCLGVGRKDNPGTHRLIQAAVLKASSSRDFDQIRLNRARLSATTGNEPLPPCSCCERRPGHLPGSCGCSRALCFRCRLCERHCACNDYRFDSSWAPVPIMLPLGQRTNMTYDVYPGST
jgi:hypothetical protein